jgi:hypothetical protein
MNMELNSKSEGPDKELPNIPKPNIVRFRCGMLHALTRRAGSAPTKPPTRYAKTIKA